MEMERILSIGGRLQKLLDDADAEVQRKVSEAERKAEEMINSAKAEAEYRRGKAQRGTGIEDLIVAEEKKAKKDAENVAGDYRKKMEELTKIPKKNLDEAVNFILKEVLPQ
jgi:vacuolar-type H+-ATPase subunit H